MLSRSSFQVFRVFIRNVFKNPNVILKSSVTSNAHVLSSSRLSYRLSDTETLEKITPGISGIVIELPRPCLRSLILDLPPTRTILPTELPISIPNLETPSSKIEEKHANPTGLVVIRRRKMKKHKLKKLRKKMKFEWAKVRQKREMRKEKEFQAVLLTQIREAEKFDAAAYVTEKLRQAKEKPLPRTWKGRRLPEFLIKQYMGIK